MAAKAYVAANLDENLLSIPDMYDLGWKVCLDPTTDERCITSPDGTTYDLERHEGLFYLRLQIVPSTAGLRAAAAAIRPTLKARGGGGAAHPVVWTRQLPTTSPPKGPPATMRSPCKQDAPALKASTETAA